MISRRDWFGVTLGAGASLAGASLVSPRLLRALEASTRALQPGALLKRAIPSSGEMLPVVGLGSSATFSQVARSEDLSALKAVLQTLVDRGASVFDTAPSYGASEQAAGDIANELGIANKIFWATKVNVLRRGGSGSADPVAARAQIEASFAKFRVPKIDLLQVHNLADVPTQLKVVNEFKQQGRVRYTGITTTSDSQYGLLEEFMRNEPMDFIGIDYAVDNRGVEEKILPLAQERKIGVLAYAPFGRTSLFRRTAGVSLPEWASEIDVNSWAQFFVKFIVSHPAITAVTPATSQAKNMIDNIGGGIGRLPDAAMRKRMADLVDALPQAARR
jgi:aryl-alcohol dehydrogenase-like predicted oxidoreductase